MIRLVVLMCVRFALSLSNAEDLPFERRIEDLQETTLRGACAMAADCTPDAAYVTQRASYNEKFASN
ncbi:hypothetical protein [Sphingomonas sp.]|uniref:hypothetical protein n=1 Tax=Sphingomonas sp. TaxID=28214 RepID=UPI0035C7B814